MGATLIKVGDHYNSSKHMEFQLETESDLAKLPGTDDCAIGSIAYLADYSKLWNLCEDNEWHTV